MSAPRPAPRLRVLGPAEVGAPGAQLLLGGKGRNLVRLARAGLPVPPWICVAAIDLPARAEDVVLAPGDEAAILEGFDRAFEPDALVAVRSSVEGEDGAEDSFAGQMESTLGVPRDRVPARVRECLASALSARAALYRRLRGRAGGPVRAAVLVQRMVEPRASGVLFTANPVTGDRREAVVAAGLGLGEGVVADRAGADTYWVDLETGAERARRVEPKTRRFAIDRARGATAAVEVPPAEARAPALSAAELAALVAAGRRAQEALGGPQDVEWAIDASGRLAILQSRPVTALGGGGRERIFDNANVVESYPGLTLPLTFSFARHAYERTFREASRVLGAPGAVLRERRAVHASLIASIEGRVYYDILNWYELFRMIPGFEGLLPAWEKALGLEPRDVPPPARPAGPAARLARAGAVLRTAGRALARLALLGRQVRRFLSRFEEVRREFSAAPLDRLDAHGLVEAYERLCDRLLEPWSVAIVNDLFCQQLYEAVRRLIDRWGLGDPEALRNELFCGIADVESVEPVRSLVALAAEARAVPELAALIQDEGRDPEDVLRTIEATPPFAAFHDGLRRHLERFGDRAVGELKLETPPIEERPAFVVAALRSFIGSADAAAIAGGRERAVRESAERAVRARLARRPLRRLALDLVLRGARATVRHRESLRLARSRAYGMVRRIFRRLGRVLAGEGRLAAPEDVFHLTVEEVAGEVRGHAATCDLRALVALRRAEIEDFARRPAPPSRFRLSGLPYRAPLQHDAPPGARAAPEAAAPAPGAVLRGIGCSRGRARARARVVTDPGAGVHVRGEILVAAATDPGWIFLMVAAAGLVVERGTPLSHTAIVGRELGIPTVVGVPEATRRIRDGDWVEIDGATGEVRLG